MPEAPPAIFFSQNFCQNSEYFREFLPKFCVKFYPKKRIITTFATKKARKCDICDKKNQRNCNITRFATKKRIKPCPIEINVNNVTSIATVYWCINVDSTFVYLGPLDFNKDSNNHICWRQMLYKGPVIIITALFSDRKTFGKSLRISVKFCHWNPKNSEILSLLEPLVQRGVQKQKITLLYTCSERGINARVKWSIISTHWPLCKTQFATKVRHHHISLFCDQIYMFHWSLGQ